MLRLIGSNVEKCCFSVNRLALISITQEFHHGKETVFVCKYTLNAIICTCGTQSRVS